MSEYLFYIHPLSSLNYWLTVACQQFCSKLVEESGLELHFVPTHGCTQRKFGIKGVLWPRQDPNLQIGVIVGDINLCALGLSTAWWTRTGRCLLGCSAPTTWNSWVPLHVQSEAQKWSSKSSRNSRLGRAQPPPMAPGHPFCKGFPTVNCCLLPRPSLRPFSFPLGCLFRP